MAFKDLADIHQRHAAEEYVAEAERSAAGEDLFESIVIPLDPTEDAAIRYYISRRDDLEERLAKAEGREFVKKSRRDASN